MIHLKWNPLNSPEADATAPERPVARRRKRQWPAVAGTLALALLIAAMIALRAPAANRVSVANARARRIDAATPTPVLVEMRTTPIPAPISASIHISQYTQLQVGDNYPAVQELQSQLSALGYLDADEPGTVYSAALADAVSLFQRAHGLEVNGEADAALQEKLFDGEALAYRVGLGDEGGDVTALQTTLSALGYLTDKATGYFGPATEAALRAFQQGNGLAVDGVFDADDRELLYAPQAKPAPGATAATPAPEKRAVEKTAAPQKTPAPEKSPAPTPEKAPETPAAVSPELPGAPALPAPPVEAVSAEATDAPALSPELEHAPVPDADSAPEPAADSDGDSAPDDSGAKADTDDDDAIEGVIRTALAQVGKPYSRGKEGPDAYDCSGLVYYCLTQNGVDVGRYSAAGYSKVGDWKKITRMSDLKRGDLIFYHDDGSSSVSHVGICLGDGTMVDASSNKSQIVHRSHTSAYWKRNFVCGRRVLS